MPLASVQSDLDAITLNCPEAKLQGIRQDDKRLDCNGSSHVQQPSLVLGGLVGGTYAGPVAKSRQAGDVIHPSHDLIVPGSRGISGNYLPI
jgi:hypothetical protein